MASIAPIPNHCRSNAQSVDALRLPEAHLKLQTVVLVTGLSESTIRRRVATGHFPKPIRHGPRCTRWIAGHVCEWLQRQAALQEIPSRH
jgi:prophage regulatory protein